MKLFILISLAIRPNGFLHNHDPMRNIEIGIHSPLAPAGTIVMPRRSRYKSHHRSVADARPCIRVGRTDGRRGHKSGTILANETVHLPGIVERRRGMTGSGRTAGMHRNCAHCLMRARRLRNRRRVYQPRALTLFRAHRHDATHRRGRRPESADDLPALFSVTRVRHLPPFHLPRRMSHSS